MMYGYTVYLHMWFVVLYYYFSKVLWWVMTHEWGEWALNETPPRFLLFLHAMLRVAAVFDVVENPTSLLPPLGFLNM